MPTIEELRLRQDMSQSTLAGLAKVSEASISRAELGRPVQKSTVEKIASALKVKPEDLSGIHYHSAVQAAQKRKRSKTEKPR